MSNINKKGLAEVITLMMIILISISAATIFSVAIIKTTAQLSPALSCGEHRISQTVKIKTSCFANGTEGEFGEIKLSLKRNYNTQLNDLEFSASNGKNKEKWVCGQSCGDCSTPKEGETKSYQLPLKIINPSSLTLSVDNCILERVKLEPC